MAISLFVTIHNYSKLNLQSLCTIARFDGPENLNPGTRVSIVDHSRLWGSVAGLLGKIETNNTDDYKWMESGLYPSGYRRGADGT